MSDSSKAEGQVIQGHLHKARRAEVPNLAEVRKYRQIFHEFLVDCTLEILEADRNKEILRIKLSVDFDVICNDSPVPNRQRGICSPIKTDDIRRFENAARKVFGNVAEPCTTAWLGNLGRSSD
ncbi:MAG: hypothetical protein QNK16_11430 [Woeseiaceae bacterium]|nr:hypothetical protein [Woeseiaceae bacterium]MDX2608987.1 hypothetical protein [Woeseiaceae bacterium]